MSIYAISFEVSGLEYASFADDTTPYSCLPEMIHILEKLEKGIQSMFDWFSENFLKANADKCHLIASSKVPVHIQISDIKVTSESRVKLLGIHIDNRFNFIIMLVSFVRRPIKNYMHWLECLNM